MTEDSSATQAPPPPPEGAPITAIAPPVADAPPVGLPHPEGAPFVAAPLDPALALPPSRRRRNLRPLWWTTASLAFVSLLALSVYLVMVSRQWQNRVDELTVISSDLGAEVVAERTAKEAALAKQASVQEQLDTATARITELANEEANATDSEAVLVNYLDAMVDCANGRQQLIDVLTDSSLYFPGKSKAQVESDLVTYCEGIKTDFATLKTELGR